MGVYLSKPIKEKISSEHENKFLKCGASSMQGWRMSQEDAHNCCLDFDSEVSLFAVYDGHGGAEVAEYASKKLPNTIKESEAYKKGDFESALKDAFLEFDSTLVKEPVLNELKSIANAKAKSSDLNSETEDETEEDDVQGLREEARMPLADVIAKYANGLPKTPALKRLRGESSKSPFLRARPSSSSASSADSEVTSSSNSSNNQDSISNGVLEGETTEVNGEDLKDNEPSDSNKSDNECEEVSSSSAINGENSESVSSSERLSAKRAVAKMFRSLITEDAEDSESDENDESFNAAADTSTAQSSDEEDTENGDEELGEDDTDEEEEEEEEEGEEEEDEGNEDDLADSSLKETEEPGNDSGCTAVVSLVTRDRVIVANAGDSRAVLSRKGEAVDLSVDHKPEDPVELKRITAAGGKVTADGRVNGGLNLSRALGDHMYKKRSDLSAAEQMITALPDIKSVDLREGEDEFIVLACDGIWNSMSSQEVVDFVRPLLAKGESPSSICEKLFENCLAEDTHGDGTGCDNMTCVIVQLFPSDKPVSSKRKCEETEIPLEETKRTKVDTQSENL